MKAIQLNHPEHPPPNPSMENCLPQNWSLVPKRLETAALEYIKPIKDESPSIYFTQLQGLWGTPFSLQLRKKVKFIKQCWKIHNRI